MEGKFNLASDTAIHLTVYKTKKLFRIFKINTVIFCGNFLDWKTKSNSSNYELIKETNNFSTGGRDVIFWVK